MAMVVVVSGDGGQWRWWSVVIVVVVAVVVAEVNHGCGNVNMCRVVEVVCRPVVVAARKCI
jgi:hypothetical protein